MQSIIIKNQNVRFEPTLLEARRTAAGAAGVEAPPPASCEKSARLVQSDGLVHAIELSCSCGEVTLIEFDYPGPEGAQPPSPPL